MRKLKIGTRKSPLALWQANWVCAQLRDHYDELELELVETISTGDKNSDVNFDAPLADVGGKGLFLKELEQDLLRGETDLAVHSMKDVPSDLPHGLTIGAICRREDARDVLVSNRFSSLAELPHGAKIGTCSLRRQCQLRAQFPHLQLRNLRGNINTRLRKLDDGEFDAIVLAAAGLKRLQLESRIGEIIDPQVCLPAAGQGAIGIECRSDDAEILKLLAAIDHADSSICVRAERIANAKLGGGCRAPVAVHATLKNKEIFVRALVGGDNKIVRGEAHGACADFEAIAHAAAAQLLANGGAEMIADYVAR